jgi:hypothetical protein
MPFVPVPNSALVELRFSHQAVKMENTLWFRGTAPLDGTELTALAQAVWNWWGLNLAGHTVAGCILREVVATDQSSATGAFGEYTSGGGYLGTVTDDPMPTGTSGAISFRTAERGRSFRGRNYMLGLARSFVTGNQLTSGYVTAVESAYAALPAVASALSLVWVVASRFSGVNHTTGKPIPRVTGIVTPVIAAVFADVFVDSQRRRLTGRGQ